MRVFDFRFHVLTALFIFCGLSVFAQSVTLDPSKYELDDTAIGIQLMDSTGYHSSLLWDRRDVLFDLTADGNVKQYVVTHTLRQIHNVFAVELYNKAYISLRRDQQLFKLKIRVIRDGKVISESDMDDVKEVDEDGVRYRLVALEGVGPGCLVETLMIMEMIYDFDGTLSCQQSSPIKEGRYRVITSPNLHLQVKAYETTAELVKDTTSTYEMYSLSATDIRAGKEEEYCFTDSHLARMEYKFESADGYDRRPVKWADIGRTYYTGVMKDAEVSAKVIDKLLAKMEVRKADNLDEKIFRIESYLKGTVAIDENVPTELDLNKIVSAGHASYYAFNRMLMLCLAQAGIQFEIMGTTSREVKKFDKGFPSETFFTHVLLYFPETRKYLSPSEVTTRYPCFDSELLGQDCMRIKREQLGDIIAPVTSVSTITSGNTEDSVFGEHYRVTIDPAATQFVSEITRSYSGFADRGLRAIFDVVDEENKTKLLDGLLKGFFENATLENTSVKNADMDKWEQVSEPLMVSGTLKGDELLEFAGDKLIVRIGEIIGQQSELYHAEDRIYPIDIDFPHIYKRHLEISVPAGYSFKGLEALNMNHVHRDETGKTLCSFTSSYELKEGILGVHITESYDRLSYPVSFFPQFAEVVNGAANFNKITILLEPN